MPLPEPSQGRILVVDDDRFIRQLIVASLKPGGFVVDSVPNALEALAAFVPGLYDAVVSDMWMPGVDGLQLLRAIREDDREVQVVLLTATVSLDMAAAATEAGAFRFVTKPFSPKALVTTVREAAETTREARAKASGAARSLAERFDVALAALWPALQPIVRWSTKETLGFEASARSDEATLSDSPALVEAAERLGRTADLGRALRARSAAALAKAPGALFVNVTAADLGDEQLAKGLGFLDRPASQVVLELTDGPALETIPDLDARVKQLRSWGFRIAIDDLGGGRGRAACEAIRPDVVKLGAGLVRGGGRPERIRSLVDACGAALVVAEGVETKAEVDALLALGIDAFQGDFVGKPAREPAA